MLSDTEFKMILDCFNRPWKGYRKVRKGVKKKIQRHMQELGCSNIRDYISIVALDSEQKKITESCLLVTISRFFRDHQLWICMAETILPVLEKEFPGQLRAWSAGCACGEEAFSLSILWHRLTAHKAVNLQMDIMATDVNPVCLERAQKGWYGKSSLKEVEALILETYFRKIPGSRQYAVRSFVKQLIRWQVHDLFIPLSEGPFHIIFLRNNLLTYYQGKEADDALQMILDRLIPKGYIVIGTHEKLPLLFIGSFKQNKCCPFIYQYTP
ncbi:MAG: CheR family methyltransferase [Thermodesulfobacteriota bacterium]